MAEVCKCDYCDSYIEYDSSDYQIAFGIPNQIYIICPVCGKRFMVDYWIEVNDSSTDYHLWYNENLNHWTIYGCELEHHGSNVCHKPIKSRKALIRQIKKWRLPKGSIVEWKGCYCGDEMHFKVY